MNVPISSNNRFSSDTCGLTGPCCLSPLVKHFFQEKASSFFRYHADLRRRSAATLRVAGLRGLVRQRKQAVEQAAVAAISVPGIAGRGVATPPLSVQAHVELHGVLHKVFQLRVERVVALPSPRPVRPRQRHDDEVGLASPPGGILSVRDAQLPCAGAAAPALLELVPVTERPQDVHARVDSANLVEASHGRMDMVITGGFVEDNVEGEDLECAPKPRVVVLPPDVKAVPPRLGRYGDPHRDIKAASSLCVDNEVDAAAAGRRRNVRRRGTARARRRRRVPRRGVPVCVVTYETAVIVLPPTAN